MTFYWACAEVVGRKRVNYHCCSYINFCAYCVVLCREGVWHISVVFWASLYYSCSASQAYVSERYNVRSFCTEIDLCSTVLLDFVQPCDRGIATFPLASPRRTTQSVRAAIPRPSQSVSTSLITTTVHRVIPLICNLPPLLELPQVPSSPHITTQAAVLQRWCPYCISEGSDFILSGNQTIWRSESGGGDWGSEYCVQVIQLCDDEIPENNENVTIVITTTTSHVTLTEDSLTLVIIDNDCKRNTYPRIQLSAKLAKICLWITNDCLVLFAVISVAFTRNTYTVVEGGEVDVCVEASGSLERPHLQLSLQASTRSQLMGDGQ